MERFNEILLGYFGPIAIIAIFCFLALIAWNIYLQIKLSRRENLSLSENESKEIKSILTEHSQEIKTLDKDIQELYNISNKINSVSQRGIHQVGMIRFNPFKDIGGDQSFSLALLNGKDNGLVISSLYTREGTRTYCKAIQNGESEKHPLTQEEEKAIKLALKKEPKKI